MNRSTGIDGDNPVTTESDQSKPETKTAAIYARTSSPTQRFGYSIQEQVRQSLEHCETQGWNVQFVFKDEAESGRDMERAQFREMMARIEEGLIDVVVFWRLDRFARSLADLVRIEDELSSRGVELKSVCEPIDTTTAVGRFSYRNLASAAELESDLTGQRTKMGMLGLAREGKWPNKQPPLGYELDEDNRLQIMPEEAELVYRIFTQYLKSRSMPAVAHWLNENGIPTKNGEKWTRQAVKVVLSNELYVGHYDVAGVTDQINEYRLLPDSLFDEVIETRFRFQNSKPEMVQSRKETKAESVLESFRAAIEGVE